MSAFSGHAARRQRERRLRALLVSFLSSVVTAAVLALTVHAPTWGWMAASYLEFQILRNRDVIKGDG